MQRRFPVWLSVPALALALGACTVHQTEEGEAPDVDVQGGKLPKYDVDPARVEVGTDTTTVEVPEIRVDTSGRP